MKINFTKIPKPLTFCLLSLGLSIPLTSSQLHAQMPQMPKQVEQNLFSKAAMEFDLTTKRVKDFADCIEELQKEYDNLDKVFDGVENLGDLSAALARGNTEVSKFIGILKKHGFDEQTWSLATQKVVATYTAIKMKAENPEMMAQFEESRREIQESTDMSEPQKQQMLAMIGNAYGQLKQIMDVPESDIAAMKPVMERLEKLFSDE